MSHLRILVTVVLGVLFAGSFFLEDICLVRICLAGAVCLYLIRAYALTEDKELKAEYEFFLADTRSSYEDLSSSVLNYRDDPSVPNMVRMISIAEYEDE